MGSINISPQDVGHLVAQLPLDCTRPESGVLYSNGVLTYPDSLQDAVTAALVPTAIQQQVAKNLLAYASTKQNAVLAQVWSFNVGTSLAPIIATTQLDAPGQAAMTQLLSWANANANIANALEPYSNVDFSPLELTPAQATSLALQAGAIKSASYAVLNNLYKAITANPPTVSSFSDIETASWPTPTT